MDLLGLDHRPVVLGLDLRCGSEAVAAASMKGIYIAPRDAELSSEGVTWAASLGAEIVADDGSTTSDVAFAEAADVGGLIKLVDTVGRRAASIVASLPSGEGVRDVFPTAEVVRYRPRPYRQDGVLVVWNQA